MLKKEELEKLVQLSLNAAVEAGKIIMEYYNQIDVAVEIKSDNSPVTKADKSASKLIMKMLEPSGFPFLSEEEEFSSFKERSLWDYYWCIDPLDGTKEFIRKSKDFTVNIALMHINYPIFGVVYLPVHQVIYFGGKDYGAYKSYDFSGLTHREIFANAEKMPTEATGNTFTIVGSHSHMDYQTKEYIQDIIEQKGEGNARIVIRGSSIKMCLVAEGSADFYPRMANIMEWDIAAGHAICEAADCTVTDWNGEELDYNKEDFRMPWFKIANKKAKDL